MNLRINKLGCYLPILMFFYLTNGYSNPQEITITGHVEDKQTGQRLQNVNIGFIKQRTGTTTNKNGEFRFTYRHNKTDTLKVTHIGYQPFFRSLAQITPLTVPITIQLESAILPMPEIKISSYRYEKERKLFLMEPSPRFFSKKDIIHIPTVAVPDLHRALQTLPGIMANNEISPRLSVRGGNLDQNLMLLDGAVIYYPYHFGLISGFNVDMIETVNISTGGFSARFGNRLSSVISVHTRGPKKDFTNQLNISLINGDVTLGGLIGSKFGWMFSGRRSYYDLLAKMAKADVPLSFQDYYGKITHQPNSKHFITLSAYQNSDTNNIADVQKLYLYSATDDDQKQFEKTSTDHFIIQNRLVSLIWEYSYSEEIQTRLQISSSIYENSFSKYQSAEYPENLAPKFFDSKEVYEEDIKTENRESQAKINNIFNDYTANFSGLWSPSPKFQIESGMTYSHFDFDYGWKGYYDFSRPYVNYFFDNSPENFYNYDNTTATQSGYVEFLWTAAKKLQFRQGVRFSHWDGVNKLLFEPRFNLKYEVNKNSSLKFAYGEFTQGIATCLEDGLLGALELYFPAMAGDHIERARHFILNFEYNNQQNFGLQITSYYKPFFYLFKSVSVNEQQLFTQTGGSAYGVELEFKTKVYGFQNSVSFVLSRSKRTYNGVTYDTNFDRRLRLQYSVQRDLGKNWFFSLFGEFYSGQPYNPGRYLALYRNLGFYNYSTTQVNVPPGRIRYPYYHRLDLYLARVFFLKGSKLTPYLSIRNLYNRKNVLYYRSLEYWKFEKNSNPKIQRNPFSLPIIPTFGLRYEF